MMSNGFVLFLYKLLTKNLAVLNMLAMVMGGLGELFRRIVLREVLGSFCEVLGQMFGMFGMENSCLKSYMKMNKVCLTVCLN